MSKPLSNNQPSLATGLAIAIGEFNDTTAINKFGYNPTVGTSWETVWDGANTYTYIASAGTATATSSDTDDNGGTVTVYGLNSSYEEVNETLTIGGSAGSVEFYRIHRAIMTTANTGDANVGTVTITADSKSAAIISPDIGQTLMAVYTVPTGKKAYLVQVDSGSSKDLEHELRLVIKHNGGVWNTKSYHTQRGGFNALKFEIPIEIPAEADVELKCKSSATSGVSGGFELILVDS